MTRYHETGGERLQVTDDGIPRTEPQMQSAKISQTPTVVTDAYTAADAVGGLLTFANAARVTGGGGVIQSVIFLDDAGQDVDLELWLFDQTFTAIADADEFDISQADMRNLVAIVPSADGAWYATGTESACPVQKVAAPYNCLGTSLFGQLVTRGTPTFAAADDVTVIIQLMQD